MSNSPPTPPEVPQPVVYLTPAGLDPRNELLQSKRDGKKVFRAARFAVGDGVIIALFAVVSFVAGLPTDWQNLLMGAVMGYIAFEEFRGARLMKRLDLRAPHVLGRNQVVFAFVLVIYAGVSLIMEAMGRGLSSHLHEAMAQLGQPDDHSFDDVAKLIVHWLYGSLIAIGVLGQGGTAVYYFSREKVLREYLAKTPEWILDAQRAGKAV